MNIKARKHKALNGVTILLPTVPISKSGDNDGIYLAMHDTAFCVNCGEDTDQYEPDIERAKCGRCGRNTVYGMEQLALRNLIEWDEV